MPSLRYATLRSSLMSVIVGAPTHGFVARLPAAGAAFRRPRTAAEH